ncbi:MAG: YaeQ family protein [Verrucomicrobia bacterium]|nr:YaeQ family protein [Verrucomicrobiota bacterium]
MSAKFSFNLTSEDRRRADLPRKILIAQHDGETVAHVTLRLLAFLIFWRPRLQVETNLHQDDIPFVPDLAQFDYQLRLALWVECGDCTVAKLDKLAVKCHDAEIWVVKRSPAEMERLRLAMKKAELRENRYSLLALDAEMFEEVCGLVQQRNEVTLFACEFDPPRLQFDFNGLWFEAEFKVLRF